jgi:hypothetical protein
MKRFWLKIAGLAIFVLAAIIGVYILLPAETPYIIIERTAIWIPGL